MRHIAVKLLAVLSLLMCAPIVDAQTTLNSSATLQISATAGQAFSQVFAGTGSIDNSYALNGTAPPGISLSTSAAPPPNTNNHQMTLAGIPGTPGVYTFNIDVTATNFSAVINYSTTIVMTVRAAASPAVAVPVSSSFATLMSLMVLLVFVAWRFGAGAGPSAGSHLRR